MDHSNTTKINYLKKAKNGRSESPEDYAESCPRRADLVRTSLPCHYVSASIFMSPIALFAGTAAGIAGPLFTELLKAKVCATQYHHDYICLNLSTPTHEAEMSHVVSATSYYSFLANLAGGFPCALFSIFAGSWSDRFGRKLPMMVPFVGIIFSAVLLVNFTYVSKHPAVLLFVPLSSALFGGWITSAAAIDSYISDNSTPNTLAINLAVFDGTHLVAANLGNIIGGVLFGYYGFTCPFMLYGGLMLITFLYILFYVRDDKVLTKKSNYDRQDVRALFTTKSLKDNKDLLVKRRPGQTRFHILLILLCLTVSATCNTGSGIINQLLFEASPLNWSLKDYMIFSGICGMLTNLVMVASTPVFKNVFGFGDTLIAIAGITSTAFSYLVLSACRNTSVAVTAAAVGSLSGLQYPATRSLLSNWVDSDERGKMMSVAASLQALVPIFGSFLFTATFAASVSWWPGCSYAISSLVMMAVLAGYCCIDRKRRDLDFTASAAPVHAKKS